MLEAVHPYAGRLLLMTSSTTIMVIFSAMNAVALSIASVSFVAWFMVVLK